MEKSVEVGVKGIIATFDSLEALIECASLVMKDGKVSFDDLQHLVELGKKYKVFGDMVSQVKDIPGEIKDMDKMELILVIGEIWEAVAKVKLLFTKA